MSALAQSGRQATERTAYQTTELDGLFDRLVADLRATHIRMDRGAPAAEAQTPGG